MGLVTPPSRHMKSPSVTQVQNNVTNHHAEMVARLDHAVIGDKAQDLRLETKKQSSRESGGKKS